MNKKNELMKQLTELGKEPEREDFSEEACNMRLSIYKLKSVIRKEEIKQAKAAWPRRERRKTLTGRLFQRIAKSPNGLTLSEMQKFLVEAVGLDWNEKDANGRRKYRGYWCTRLTGGWAYGPGILGIFCLKVDGRWRINSLYNGKAFVSADGKFVANVFMKKGNN